MLDKKLLEKELHITFHDIDLLEEAFTHSSMSYKKSYERLEFLGDRILSLIIADFLFFASDDNEGQLSRALHQMIDKESLSHISSKLNLQDHLISTLDAQEISESVRADLVESLIAVIYIEHGLMKTKEVIHHLWHEKLRTDKKVEKDPRSLLQEKCQEIGKPIPHYEVIEKTGEDHNPIFTCQVTCHLGEMTAQASTKKDGYRKAAFLLLEEYIKNE